MRMTVFLASFLCLGACGPFRRANAPLPPPTPMPARIPDQVSSTEPAPAPKNLPPPPPIAAPGPDTRPSPTAAMSIPATPTTPPPSAPKPKRPARRAAAPPPPPVQEMPEEQPAPVYRLGELRSPEEKEKLRKQTEDMIGVCSAALSAAERRTLTSAQSEMVNRVRTFAQQARDALDKDPGEARSFAAKGKTFAEALLAELK